MEQESVKCWFEEVCNSFGTSCDICKNKGLHYLTQKVYIEKTMIPLAYRYTELNNLTLPPDTSSLSKYFRELRDLIDKGEGFFAYGPKTGTGKTTIGCIALIRYLYYSLKRDPYDDANRRVLYLNVPEFMDRLRKSFNYPDLPLEGLLEELTSLDTAPKLLLFDDIGAEKPSDWVRERLYTLINYRVSNGLANIFTSNETPESLGYKLGPRILSRIESTKAIHFTGKDRRNHNW